ncbi:MAG: Crp/Fnr family transcriptional regulator [Acidobacteriia bacterium]|nr:Crp/Fnr family transcriptional regulator [Terriglobia bacterium]
MRNNQHIAPRRLNGNEALWAELEGIATRTAVGKGKTLFRQGDAGRGVFLLRKGKLMLSMHPRGHKKLLYRTIGPGHILGLPATLSDAPYSLTAKGLADCELAFIQAEEVVDLLKKRGDLCLHAVEIMAHEVRQLRRRQASLISLKPAG